MQSDYAICFGTIPVLSDTLYRYTLRILKYYRSYGWQLKVFTCRLSGFTEDTGTAAPKPAAEGICRETGAYPDHEQQKLRNQIFFLSEHLSLIDRLADLIRNDHPHGEQYYWILYYTFLSPQELKGVNEIIEKLRTHISNISYRTYYRKRHAAIEALSTILWGFTAKETIKILNDFFPEG